MKTAEELRELSNSVVMEIDKYPEPDYNKDFDLYIDKISAACEKQASKGYGGIPIMIDFTTELFMKDEGIGACYIAREVIQYLKDRFQLIETNDHYDAKDFNLIWNSERPIAPIKKVY